MKKERSLNTCRSAAVQTCVLVKYLPEMNCNRFDLSAHSSSGLWCWWSQTNWRHHGCPGIQARPGRFRSSRGEHVERYRTAEEDTGGGGGAGGGAAARQSTLGLHPEGRHRAPLLITKVTFEKCPLITGLHYDTQHRGTWAIWFIIMFDDTAQCS